MRRSTVAVETDRRAAIAVAGYGYLHKVRVGDVDQVVRAVEEIAAGGSVLAPRIARRLVDHRAKEPASLLGGQLSIPPWLAMSACGAKPRRGLADYLQGLRVVDLAAIPDVRAVMIAPAHQFPTGVVLEPARRAALLE